MTSSVLSADGILILGIIAGLITGLLVSGVFKKGPK